MLLADLQEAGAQGVIQGGVFITGSICERRWGESLEDLGELIIRGPCRMTPGEEKRAESLGEMS